MTPESYPNIPGFFRWEGTSSVLVIFFLETLTLATLNKSIREHGPFIIQTFTYLPYAQCKTYLGPGGASPPMGNV